jgi:hypothetical protein
MHGFTYMQFIVPGLIMMAVITNAYQRGVIVLQRQVSAQY